ncbi:2-succinyl-6-hydroxy-2,4-cyclohexadiene-1-carboxylate synthase [subsurface metagenome]
MKLEVITRGPVSNARAAPVVFVHGMWHAAWCWSEHFLPYFAQHGYVSYALSLRGHGASEGRERLRWTSLADYVADMFQVTDQLQTSPVLVGHSMGGMIVQKYLESHQAPAAVLLASAPVRGLLLPTLRLARRHPLAFLMSNLTLSTYHVVATRRLTQEAFFSADMPQEKLTTYFARMQYESYRAYLDMMGLDLPHPRQIKTPMLVLGAGNDTMISSGDIEATARAYGTEAEIFPDMAHDMMLEAGWQAVADRILGWLSEQGL